MASIDQIRASDGSGNANLATVQSTRAPLSSTIVVDTVAGINDNFMGSMGTPHTFTDPITSETITVISEATCVDFSGHVDGANLEIDDIAPGYTDLGSEIGDIIIIRPTTQYADNIADVLDAAHDDDGTLKDNAVTTNDITNLAVTTAKIAAGAVTAAKLATAPSRFVAIDPAILVVNADPANTNWTAVDVTANTSATATAVSLRIAATSSDTTRSAYLRKTGSSAAQGATNQVVTTNVANVACWGHAVVLLDASQSFDWSVNHANVTQILVVIDGYWETVA